MDKSCGDVIISNLMCISRPRNLTATPIVLSSMGKRVVRESAPAVLVPWLALDTGVSILEALLISLRVKSR